MYSQRTVLVYLALNLCVSVQASHQKQLPKKQQTTKPDALSILLHKVLSGSADPVMSSEPFITSLEVLHRLSPGELQSEKPVKKLEQEIRFRSDALVRVLNPSWASVEDPSDNYASIYHAIHADDASAVLFFLAKPEIDINGLAELPLHGGQNYHCTPLIYALLGRRAESARVLIENFASPDTANKHGATALMFAANLGMHDILNTLINRSTNINTQSLTGTTALMLAARNGFLECVKLLVKCGADLNMQDNGGHTALMMAVVCGHLAIVEYLLKARADITLVNKTGYAALDLAHAKNQTDIVKLLEKYIKKVDWITPLNNGTPHTGGPLTSVPAPVLTGAVPTPSSSFITQALPTTAAAAGGVQPTTAAAAGGVPVKIAVAKK